MCGRDRPGQFPIRPNPPGEHPLALQQALALRRPSLGRLQPKILPLGSNLLQSPSGQRPHPCLSFATLGQPMVEDPLDHVAGRQNLRLRTAHTQPTTTRLLAAQTGSGQILNPMRTTPPKKQFTTQRTSYHPYHGFSQLTVGGINQISCPDSECHWGRGCAAVPGSPAWTRHPEISAGNSFWPRPRRARP